MKGKINFSVKNAHIKFRLTLERNITIITGDSGTGKTKLINMVRQYSEFGKKSGISLSCDKECIVLEGKNWEYILSKISGAVIFIEESTNFLKSYEFAKNIQNTDNYYVIVTREPLPQIPYSVDSIKQIEKSGKNPRIERKYKNTSIRKVSDFPYDLVIVEDSHSGFQFFRSILEDYPAECVSADGKSNILQMVKKNKGKKVLVIADSAAFGSEIREIENYRKTSSDKIDMFLPESFEWLILNSDVFASNSRVKTILANPIEYIESMEFFSWEKYFEYLLTDVTKDSRDLKYIKSKLSSGYLINFRKNMILRSME